MKYRWRYEILKDLAVVKLSLLRDGNEVACFFAPRMRDRRGLLLGTLMNLMISWTETSLNEIFTQVIHAPGLKDEDRAMCLGIREMTAH